MACARSWRCGGTTSTLPLASFMCGAPTATCRRGGCAAAQSQHEPRHHPATHVAEHVHPGALSARNTRPAFERMQMRTRKPWEVATPLADFLLMPVVRVKFVIQPVSFPHNLPDACRVGDTTGTVLAHDELPFARPSPSAGLFLRGEVMTDELPFKGGPQQRHR
jgi:hypothetical protein